MSRLSSETGRKFHAIMATPRPSDAIQAASRMTHHSFAPGAGYIDHGTPLVSANINGPAGNCDPPEGTVDRSRHILANGNATREFTWIAKDGAWARFGGNRMAWTAVYLSQSGWCYVGLAPTPAAT